MTTTPDEKPASKAAEKPEESKRYCAYDSTLLRFIGKTHESKTTVNAQDEVKAAKKAGHDIEVREV